MPNDHVWTQPAMDGRMTLSFRAMCTSWRTSPGRMGSPGKPLPSAPLTAGRGAGNGPHAHAIAAGVLGGIHHLVRAI